jgi:uncharacterized protein YbjQ (UPF0145 family)
VQRSAEVTRGYFSSVLILEEAGDCFHFLRSTTKYYNDTMTNEIIIVSTPYVPGYKITKTIGVTWGLIVRSRGLGRNITAGLRSLVGGEIHEYTELLNQSREEALDRLKEHALALGANAVVSMRFDSSEMGETMTELLAYGTAVTVEKETMPSSPVRLG